MDEVNDNGGESLSANSEVIVLDEVKCIFAYTFISSTGIIVHRILKLNYLQCSS